MDFKVLTDNIIDLISKKYSYLCIKQNEFKEIKEGLSKELPNVDSCNSALKILEKYLSVFKDGHINVVDGQSYTHQTFNLNGKNYDNKVADSYLSNIEKIGPINLGNLEDVLYIRFDTFSESQREHFMKLYSTNPSNEKFIIDLRSNTGGNSFLTEPLVNFMFGNNDNRKKLKLYLRKRIDENNPLILSDFKPNYIFPKFEHDAKKIVTLIGPKTYSAAELATLGLKTVKDNIVIGDVSGGGTGTPLPYLCDGVNFGRIINFDEKPNDFGAKFGLALPSLLIYDADKNLIQNRGITPDIIIPSDESIINNKDLVLEKALELLK